MSENKLLVILGATASGKTKLAVQLAEALNGEIISADSRQVFSGMDIGTGKDLEEYADVPYHLIDILPAGESYNVNRFKEDFYTSFISITQQKKQAILCGGTGMYIHSLFQNQAFTAVPSNLILREKLLCLSKQDLLERLKEYPNEFTQHADLSSSKRLIRAIEIADFLISNELPKVQKVDFKPIVVGLKNERENQRINILNRLKLRLKNGLIEEVERLHQQGVCYDKLIFYGLEYKFISMYLQGEINYHEMEEKLGIAICQFAKRQETFFRKMEKDGVNIHWLDAQLTTQELKEKVIGLMKA
ncbi:MAG: tRNA (adenosine(37)-N6)-dimethylallyltransferase MiaA [Sphingobacteriaceae bacterium]|nr:tRNA (adenosine(37)-N6)-dimethylallyltransferase MiaA [Sphingobacteriaceae bacterium]